MKSSLSQLVEVAAAHHAAGRLDLAEAAYREILTIAPNWAEAHNNLGCVLQDQSRLDEAAQSYQRAVSLNADYPVALHNLGFVRQMAGQLEEAAALYEQSIALDPNYAQPQCKLGVIRRRQGRFDEAIKHLRQAVLLGPDDAAGHNHLGAALKDANRQDEAARHFQLALALDPENADAHNNLGCALHVRGKLAEAVACFERSIALRPDDAQAHYNLGVVLKEQGKLDEAARQYTRACSIDPTHADAHNNLGNVLKDQGKLKPAAAEYAQAIAISPRHAQAHFNRAELKTFRRGDPDLALLESLLADIEQLGDSRKPYVYFALAKAMDDLGDYARASELLLAGNAHKRRQVHYDEAGTLATLRKIADVFSLDLLHRLRGGGDPLPAPIFIVGMPRSGSTLVEQILSSHPQVHGAGELKAMGLVANEMTDAAGRALPYPALVESLDADRLRRLGSDYLARLPQSSCAHITDKMPGNFMYAGLIHLLLPRARIIHTRRDPADTCLSCFSKLFAEGAEYSYDLGELGRYYRGYNKLIDHWRRVLPAGAMLEVSYEELIDDLQGQVKRLLEYCGLEWDARCLEYHRNTRAVSTASSVQVRQAPYRGSIGRWRRYEGILVPLLRELNG